MKVEIGTELFAVWARGAQLNAVHLTYVCNIPSWLLVKQIADVKCAHKIIKVLLQYLLWKFNGATTLCTLQRVLSFYPTAQKDIHESTAIRFNQFKMLYRL
jgi:hypothetical protein